MAIPFLTVDRCRPRAVPSLRMTALVILFTGAFRNVRFRYADGRKQQLNAITSGGANDADRSNPDPYHGSDATGRDVAAAVNRGRTEL